MKKVLLLAGAIVAAVPAWAEWSPFSSTVDSNYFVDLSTARSNGSTRRVWVMNNYTRRDQFGDLSAKMLWQFDCADERVRTLQAHYFSEPMLEGASQATSGERPWRYISPNTPPARLAKQLC